MITNTAILAMLAADVTSVLSDATSTLVRGAVSVTGTAGPITAGDAIDADGLLITSGVEFVGNLSSFVTVPTCGEVWVLDGTPRRVKAATSDGACVTLTLDNVADRTSTGGLL